MPLRALIDGTEYLAPGISSRQWEYFRSRIRSGESTLLLPCCRKNGFLRTSVRGLQHFVHSRSSSCSRARGESQASLGISTTILRTALALRMKSTADVTEAGVHLPVLITIPGRSGRLAFLGYEKRYRSSEMSVIQKRLLAVHIRACWLLPGEDLPPVSEDLPQFALDRAGPLVRLAGSGSRPLAEFIEDLLSGRYKFRPALTAARSADVGIHFSAIHCASCNAPVTVFWLSGQHQSLCSLDLPPFDAERYRPEVLAAARNAAREHGLVLGHVEWGKDFSPQSGAVWCPSCKAPIEEYRIQYHQRAPKRSRDVVSEQLEIRWKVAPRFPFPHWCLSTSGKFC